MVEGDMRDGGGDVGAVAGFVGGGGGAGAGDCGFLMDLELWFGQRGDGERRQPPGLGLVAVGFGLVFVVDAGGWVVVRVDGDDGATTGYHGRYHVVHRR